MSTVLHCVYLAWKHPTLLDRDNISGQSTRFFTTNTALRAVKGTEKCDESHDDLARQCVGFTITLSVTYHRVYITWNHPFSFYTRNSSSQIPKSLHILPFGRLWTTEFLIGSKYTMMPYLCEPYCTPMRCTDILEELFSPEYSPKSRGKMISATSKNCA